jgi:hypothetical protein
LFKKAVYNYIRQPKTKNEKKFKPEAAPKADFLQCFEAFLLRRADPVIRDGADTESAKS